jgi:hypothetical protein
MALDSRQAFHLAACSSFKHASTPRRTPPASSWANCHGPGLNAPPTAMATACIWNVQPRSRTAGQCAAFRRTHQPPKKMRAMNPTYSPIPIRPIWRPAIRISQWTCPGHGNRSVYFRVRGFTPMPKTRFSLIKPPRIFVFGSARPRFVRLGSGRVLLLLRHAQERGHGLRDRAEPLMFFSPVRGKMKTRPLRSTARALEWFRP